MNSLWKPIKGSSPSSATDAPTGNALLHQHHGVAAGGVPPSGEDGDRITLQGSGVRAGVWPHGQRPDPSASLQWLARPDSCDAKAVWPSDLPLDRTRRAVHADGPSLSHTELGSSLWEPRPFPRISQTQPTTFLVFLWQEKHTCEIEHNIAGDQCP